MSNIAPSTIQHNQSLSIREKALLALSGAPDKLPVQVHNNTAYCPECKLPLGAVVGRHLETATFIVVNRVVFRCIDCRTKLLWEPPSLTNDVK